MNLLPKDILQPSYISMKKTMTPKAKNAKNRTKRSKNLESITNWIVEIEATSDPLLETQRMVNELMRQKNTLRRVIIKNGKIEWVDAWDKNVPQTHRIAKPKVIDLQEELQRWRAEEGGEYWIVGKYGLVERYHEHYTIEDNTHYVMGNYYKSIKHAEASVRWKVMNDPDAEKNWVKKKSKT